jgi:hypothetical protein
MMKVFFPALLLMLTACDGSVPPPEPEIDPRQANPAFETQIQAVDKARAVEGQLLDAAEAQRQQVDQATQ